MNPNRKQHWKRNLIALGTILTLSSLSPVQANAQTKEQAKGISIEARASKLTNIKLNNSLEKHEIEQKQVEDDARKEADEKSKKLTKEREKNWEKEFPAVEGDNREAKFINSIAKDAVALANDSELYASVMIAQASLESNYGKSGLSSKYQNLFGVKGSYKGESANLSTREDVGSGQMIRIKSGFRVYPSYKESLKDYADLLHDGIKGDSEYYSSVWKTKTDNFKDATRNLQGLYATDTAYAAKLNKIIVDFNLTSFDKIESLPKEPVEVAPAIPPVLALSEEQYVIKPTDSLADIEEIKLADNQVTSLDNSDESANTSNKRITIR